MGHVGVGVTVTDLYVDVGHVGVGGVFDAATVTQVPQAHLAVNIRTSSITLHDNVSR